MNSITYDICGEQKAFKVESDLILVTFMGESRKCGGSDASNYLVGDWADQKIIDIHITWLALK